MHHLCSSSGMVRMKLAANGINDHSAGANANLALAAVGPRVARFLPLGVSIPASWVEI